MKVKKKLFFDLYSLILSITVFFNYIFEVQLPIIIVLTYYLIIVIRISKEKINFYMYDFIIFLYPMTILLLSFNSNEIESTIKYFLGVMSISISCILISKKREILHKIIKLFMVFSGIHVACTLIYTVFPDFIIGINKMILSPLNYQKNYYEMTNNGINCGITPVQSLNAIYISIFIGLVVSKIS
jgi:hypothetical protein